MGPLDDAAVVRPEGAVRSVVLTVDVITPIVDDPRAFGGIAAANSISDVYAMGGRPEVALSFVGFPTDILGLEVLAEVLQGIRDVCARAGCAIVGGHTIADSEPKCGLAVVGSVDPERIWSQRNARAGQALVLTKPLGIGIVGGAIKTGTAPPEMLATATAQMLALNDVARDVGLALGATSCTDVTGFGLLGHLKHIVEASDLRAVVDARAVPLIDGVLALAAAGAVPGGTKRNLAYASPVTRFDDDVPAELRLVLADAQTSGGLLLCLPAESASEAVRRLAGGGVARAAIVGRLEAPEGAHRILVRN